jgi:hypothetical protein
MRARVDLLLSVLFGALAVLVPGFALQPASAQVQATRPFSTYMERALGLEAGATASDLPHHVHYDLKLYNHKGKLTTGTWDLWRDPQHSIRVDIVAGDFHYTHIEDLILKKQWRHFNTFMPLKVFDLRQDYAEPQYAVQIIAEEKPARSVYFQQIDKLPFDCANDLLGPRICFDPIAHVLAFAELWNQSMTWEDWQPLGVHSVPQRFRIYDAGRVMVEAAGHAEIVKTFPRGIFIISANEPDMGEPELDGSIPHKVISMKPENLQPLYGNVLMQVTVGVDGKVKKLTLIDADDDDIVGDAKHFAKRLTFAPEIKNGEATPFETYLYLSHGPLGP